MNGDWVRREGPTLNMDGVGDENLKKSEYSIRNQVNERRSHEIRIIYNTM